MAVKELYVLGYFDREGNFGGFVRKGRNHSISGYDNISSAKRGLAQSKTGARFEGQYKIVKATGIEVIK